MAMLSAFALLLFSYLPRRYGRILENWSYTGMIEGSVIIL